MKNILCLILKNAVYIKINKILKFLNDENIWTIYIHTDSIYLFDYCIYETKSNIF